jgi:hypothetical protein
LNGHLLQLGRVCWVPKAVTVGRIQGVEDALRGEPYPAIVGIRVLGEQGDAILRIRNVAKDRQT